MKIGDEVYVHGYVDEIRNDVIIIRNNGGYFGTVPNEIEPQTEYKKWETKPNADRPTVNTTCMGVAMALVEDEPQTCDTCKYGEDKHRYAHICNECGVGINSYEPKTERSK